MNKLFQALLGLLISNSALAVDLSGVKNFQVENYLGTWYQIESTNPFFQRGCLCAKAEYTRKSISEINVVNTCVNERGSARLASGTASILDPNKPSRLAVKLSLFTPRVTNYVVTEVGQDYEYAVIVSPNQTAIWILSRTKELSPSTLAGIHLRLIKAGVKIGTLKDTDPNRCPDL